MDRAIAAVTKKAGKKVMAMTAEKARKDEKNISHIFNCWSGTTLRITKMDATELVKSKAYITVEIIEYVPNSVVIKTILKKTTGNISVMSVDSGEGLTEKTTPFDTFVQIIDGKAEIMIEGKPYLLLTGESMVIPAHAPNYIKPNGRFKMILTVIKSGYEYY